MQMNRPVGWGQRSDHGLSLVVVAFGMVMLLGMLGLGIDLASLYVGRTQAQRAADAAALAGAEAIANSGYPSGLVTQGAAEAYATDRALAVGNSNLIAGVSANMTASSLSFNFGNAANPQITVVAERTTANGNPMPTFFMKIFGMNTVNVSATATAEVFSPSGTGLSVGASCVKPWLIPNCDQTRIVYNTAFPANTNCPEYNPDGSLKGYDSYFINPPPPDGSGNGQIVYPGLTPAGVIGENIQPYTGGPSPPSKYMAVCIPPGTTPAICPSCANGGGGTAPNAASLYRSNIECCNQTNVVCGDNVVQPINGGMVGPTQQGVGCLINAGPGNTGQDTLNISSVPFTVTAGSNNPFFPAGSTISVSDSTSTVTVPIYNGTNLCPGGSCPATLTVDVLGFMQIFIANDAGPPQGAINAYILNVAGCGSGGSGGTGGSGGSGSSGPIVTGATPIPVRLIHP